MNREEPFLLFLYLKDPKTNATMRTSQRRETRLKRMLGG